MGAGLTILLGMLNTLCAEMSGHPAGEGTLFCFSAWVWEAFRCVFSQ